MRRDDSVLALDIVLAVQRIQEYIGSMTRAEFEKSTLHQDAVIRQCTIVGEAARNLSDEFRSAHPEVSWSNLVGFRNVLAHGYFKVNLETVWETVQNAFPILVSVVQPLIPPEEPDGNDKE